MDTPKGICFFFSHSDFTTYLEQCQVFNLDVTDEASMGFDAIIFFDILDFVLFLGLVSNLNPSHIVWEFL